MTNDKELDKLIQEIQLENTGNKEAEYNDFDAPVPGESLTNTPGNAAWEMGRDGTIGSLTVGKKADFIVLNKNPLTTKVPKYCKYHVKKK